MSEELIFRHLMAERVNMDDIYIRKSNVRVDLEWRCLGFVSCGRFRIGFRSNNAAVTSEFCPVTASVLVSAQNENMMAG